MEFGELQRLLLESPGRVRVRDAVSLPFLQREPLSIVFEPEHLDRAALINALVRLTGLPEMTRSQIEEAIYNFYLKEIEDGSASFASAQAQLDWEAEQGVPFQNPKAAQNAAEVWPLVQFRRIVPSSSAGRDLVLRVEGNAAWDGEHGIVLHFLNGEQLIAATGYGRFL